jgi:hypothetical protein
MCFEVRNGDPWLSQNVSGFTKCRALVGVIFEIPSSLRELHGFDDCDSLRELEIPPLLVRIDGFNRCGELRRVTFVSGSRFEELSGFDFCPLPSPLELPNSIRKLFVTLTGPGRVITAPSTMITSLDLCHPVSGDERVRVLFVDCTVSGLKNSRRCLNFGLSLPGQSLHDSNGQFWTPLPFS